MNLAQLCDRTGLQEKTICYYFEMKLALTHLNQSFQTDYDFSENDVQDLIQTIHLKKAFFTNEDIIKIKAYPGNIPNILDEWYQNLHIDNRKRKFCKFFAEIDFKTVDSVTILSEIIGDFVHLYKLPLTDLEENQYEAEPLCERDYLFHKNGHMQDWMIQSGKMIVNIIAIFYALGTIFGLVFGIVTGESYVKVILLTVLRIIIITTLLLGKSWAPYFYCAFSILIVLSGLYTLSNTLPQSGGVITNYNLLPKGIDMLYSISTSMILISSRAVKKYLFNHVYPQ